MIFTYTPAGQKRLTIPAWFALDKWPHGCPQERHHLHFVVVHGGREYRCGPAIPAMAAQVSAMIYRAKPFTK